MTVPASLVQFRHDLEAAIERERRGSRRTRRLALRVAVASGAAAAVAVGALTLLPGDPAGRLVERASAAERAAAALAPAPGSVVHVELVVTQTAADGSRTTWREESWQQTSPPYDVRRVVTPANGAPAGSTPQPATAEPFRDQVLDLLRSGKLSPAGRSVVDGRRTVSFAWSDGHSRYEYAVDPATYDPVRWRISRLDGTTAATVTFETYEVVAADRTP